MPRHNASHSYSALHFPVPARYCRPVIEGRSGRSIRIKSFLPPGRWHWADRAQARDRGKQKEPGHVDAH